MEFKRTAAGILYLYEYYPVKYADLHRGISEQILLYKKGYKTQIKQFAPLIEEALIKEIRRTVISNANTEMKMVCESDNAYFMQAFRTYLLSVLSGLSIVVAPSHQVNEWSASLLITADRLSKDLGLKNHKKAIIRTVEHDKLTTGGKRSIASHISSMKLCRDVDFSGKNVIILDDITTTGNTLAACTYVLKQAGAKRIIPIALAKTAVPKTVKAAGAFCGRDS